MVFFFHSLISAVISVFTLSYSYISSFTRSIFFLISILFLIRILIGLIFPKPVALEIYGGGLSCAALNGSQQPLQGRLSIECGGILRCEIPTLAPFCPTGINTSSYVPRPLQHKLANPLLITSICLHLHR